MAVRVEQFDSHAAQSWAPGRVTFVGDHTDYNFGLCLATTLPRGTRVRVSTPSDHDEFVSLDGRGPAGWESYASACLRLVRDSGASVPAVRIEVWSDLPIGMGLSSSASLISATLSSIYGVMGMQRSPDLLAIDAQRVENVYLGIPTGTLDQEVIVKNPDHAVVLMDFGRERVATVARMPLEGHRFLVIDSGVSRRLDTTNYGDRRAECTEAIDLLFGSHDREAWLRFRDRSWPEIQEVAQRRRLSGLVLGRLAHVWSENRRVEQMATALKAADVSAIANVLNQSHASLRDDFDVSTRRIERVRSSILEQRGVRAARMVGAGFGGCLLALVTEGAVIAGYPTFALVRG